MLQSHLQGVRKKSLEAEEGGTGRERGEGERGSKIRYGGGQDRRETGGLVE